MDLFNTHPSRIFYKNNTEYRQCLRTIFDFSVDARSFFAGLSKKDMVDDPDLDEESRDEMHFDWEKMQTGMDFILKHTIQEPLFHELYELAAATMLSTDILIGQTVLFSYDHFPLFYTCLWHFFIEKTQPLSTVPEYQQLLLVFRK